jgi:hypothetical protein
MLCGGARIWFEYAQKVQHACAIRRIFWRAVALGSKNEGQKITLAAIGNDGRTVMTAETSK